MPYLHHHTSVNVFKNLCFTHINRSLLSTVHCGSILLCIYSVTQEQNCWLQTSPEGSLHGYIPCLPLLPPYGFTVSIPTDRARHTMQCLTPSQPVRLPQGDTHFIAHSLLHGYIQCLPLLPPIQLYSKHTY